MFLVASGALFLHGARPSKRAKHFLARPTYWAFPVLWKILKRSFLGNLPFAVASVRIIDVSTVDGLALPHLLGSSHGASPLHDNLKSVKPHFVYQWIKAQLFVAQTQTVFSQDANR
jgi:hypothetical protein